MTLSDFTVGDRVEYRLPGGWMPATVVKVTEKRIVIKLDRYPNGKARNTTPEHVRRVGASHG